MTPSTCLVIEKMPLVASLKIDRRQVNTWLSGIGIAPEPVELSTMATLLPSELTAIALSKNISSLVASKNERRRSALDRWGLYW